jgi:hypothetical protein
MNEPGASSSNELAPAPLPVRPRAGARQTSRSRTRRFSQIVAGLVSGIVLAESAVRAEPPPKTLDESQQPSTASAPAADVRAPEMAEAMTCFRDGQAAYVAGDLAKALRGFLCAFERAPSLELHWNLARVYERMGEADEGIRHYRAYLDQNEVTPRERKRVEARMQALAQLRVRQRAVLTEPKPSRDVLSAEARRFYDRGVALFGRGQYQAAIAAFSAALQMSGAPELHYNLAVSAERLQRYREASDHYRAYLAASSDPADRPTIEARIAELRARPEGTR